MAYLLLRLWSLSCQIVSRVTCTLKTVSLSENFPTFTESLTVRSLAICFCTRLIAIAFFLAKGFIKTGLGNRIAYLVVSLFGKTSLGLTYSLVFSELFLAPAIPSLAARAGGIFLPLSKVTS